VATPRVTALNNRAAQIESGSQIPVQTTAGRYGDNDREHHLRVGAVALVNHGRKSPTPDRRPARHD